jgi:hypothetical protein
VASAEMKSAATSPDLTVGWGKQQGPPARRAQIGLSGATIRDWKIDRARYVATPVMSDGREGPPLELRGLFEQFLYEAG